MSTDQKAAILVTYAPVIGTVLLAGFGWLVKLARGYLIARTKSVKFHDAVTRVAYALTTAVGEIEQTTVKALKEQSGGGRLTPEGRKVAVNAAMDSIRNHLGAGITEIQAAMGPEDLTEALRSGVEALMDARNSAGAPVIPPAVKAVAAVAANQLAPIAANSAIEALHKAAALVAAKK